MNTGDIPDSATAPGLDEARSRLKLDRMNKAELDAYYRHLDNIVILRDNIFTERAEGREEGREEGRAEGRVEGCEEGKRKEQIKIARQMMSDGMPMDVVFRYTGISEKDLNE